jgi:hypothetical protein
MVKMKGGVSGAGIGLILLIVLIVIIVVSVGLYFLLKKLLCTEVTKDCEDDDDCCNSLKCKSKKCCSTSTKVCSKDNECCGTLKCKDKKCTELSGPPGEPPEPGPDEPPGPGPDEPGPDEPPGPGPDEPPGPGPDEPPEPGPDEPPEPGPPEPPELEPCFEKCTNIGNRQVIGGSLCNDKTKLIPIDKENDIIFDRLECCEGSSLYKPSCSNASDEFRKWSGEAGYNGKAINNFPFYCTGDHQQWYCK